MHYEEEYPYYEPTIADEIMMEYQQKMKDVLLDNIKNELNLIKEENNKLKEENKQARELKNELLRKERDLKYREDNYKREVEKEFYETNIGDTLKQYIEDCEIWFADLDNYRQEKCDLCNEERKLTAKFLNGKKTEIQCDCAKMLQKYIPGLSAISLIKFSKRNSRYSSNRSFYLSRTYSPPNKSNYDYDYQEFKICYVVDKFNEDTIKLHENMRYGEKLGFRSKEECQKYCDWRNKSIRK